jgi:hypothetical protein
MNEKERLELDLYAIGEEAKNKEKIRRNPKKYEVSDKRAKEIMANLKPITDVKDVLVA